MCLWYSVRNLKSKIKRPLKVLTSYHEKTLSEWLDSIKDYRNGINHKLMDILVVAVLSVLFGLGNWEYIYEPEEVKKD